MVCFGATTRPSTSMCAAALELAPHSTAPSSYFPRSPTYTTTLKRSACASTMGKSRSDARRLQELDILVSPRSGQKSKITIRRHSPSTSIKVQESRSWHAFSSTSHLRSRPHSARTTTTPREQISIVSSRARHLSIYLHHQPSSRRLCCSTSRSSSGNCLRRG